MKKKYNKDLAFAKMSDDMLKSKMAKNGLVKACRKKDRRGRNCRSVREGCEGI